MASELEETPQRWTARRRSALVLSLLKGETSAAEAARKHGLTVGQVEHGRCSTAVLSDAEKAEGSFLSCQARPLSDLIIELTTTNRYRRPSAAWRALVGS